MVDIIRSEIHLLCFLANSTNFKQAKACIYEMDRHQLHVIREIAYNIKLKVITTAEEDFITENSDFLNKLIDNDLSWGQLEQKSAIIIDICRFALQYFSLCGHLDSETDEEET